MDKLKYFALLTAQITFQTLGGQCFCCRLNHGLQPMKLLS